MIKYEEKFIVINKKHLDKLPYDLSLRLKCLLKDISDYLPNNKYYVCNQDEPYASKVIDIIIKGENNKINERAK
jgi:hypothetical protein